jgi:hypothetical protein
MTLTCGSDKVHSVLSMLFSLQKRNNAFGTVNVNVRAILILKFVTLKYVSTSKIITCTHLADIPYPNLAKPAPSSSYNQYKNHYHLEITIGFFHLFTMFYAQKSKE